MRCKVPLHSLVYRSCLFIYISYLVFRRYILLYSNDFLVTEATFIVYKSYIPCFQKLHSSKQMLSSFIQKLHSCCSITFFYSELTCLFSEATFYKEATFLLWKIQQYCTVYTLHKLRLHLIHRSNILVFRSYILWYKNHILDHTS